MRQQTGPARCVQTLSRHSNVVRGLTFAPGGSRLASASWDGSVKLWDRESRRCLTGSGSQRQGDAGEMFVWDAHSGQRVRAWAPSGERLISGGSDGRLRWWEVPSGQCVQVQEAHQGAIRSLRSSPNGSRLASCGDDGAITIWDLESSEHLRTLRRERLEITGVKGLTEAQKATLRVGGYGERSCARHPARSLTMATTAASRRRTDLSASPFHAASQRPGQGFPPAFIKGVAWGAEMAASGECGVYTTAPCPPHC